MSFVIVTGSACSGLEAVTAVSSLGSAYFTYKTRAKVEQIVVDACAWYTPIEALDDQTLDSITRADLERIANNDDAFTKVCENE